jgi:hypothetical protein
MAQLVDDAHALADLIEKANRLMAESETAPPERLAGLWREAQQIIREVRLIYARHNNLN